LCAGLVHTHTFEIHPLKHQEVAGKIWPSVKLKTAEFARFGTVPIGSSKNRSNPMPIINFDLGARIAGTIGHFVVSLEAPSYYEWAPA
jgi:hypothetical protein